MEIIKLLNSDDESNANFGGQRLNDSFLMTPELCTPELFFALLNLRTMNKRDLLMTFFFKKP